MLPVCHLCTADSNVYLSVRVGQQPWQYVQEVAGRGTEMF